MWQQVRHIQLKRKKTKQTARQKSLLASGQKERQKLVESAVGVGESRAEVEQQTAAKRKQLL